MMRKFSQKHLIFSSLFYSDWREKLKVGFKGLNPLLLFEHKQLLTKLSLVVMLLLFGFTSTTYAQDTDGDGIVDSLDLDNDNDGILDLTECANSPCGNIMLAGMTQNINIYEVVSDTCSYTDGGTAPEDNCRSIFNPSNINNANWINDYVTGSNTCIGSASAINQTSSSASSNLICDNSVSYTHLTLPTTPYV